MSATEISTSHALKVRQYDDEAYRELLPKTFFKPYMGMDPNSVVHMKENLKKGRGDSDTIGLIRALVGEGVTGESTLEGNEEEMLLDDCTITIDELSHAVRLKGALSERRTQFDLKAEARPQLTDWLAQQIDDKLFEAGAKIDNTVYASASESAKDAWLVANADRMQFGASVSNASSNDHSTALAQIDSSADKLTTTLISLIKRRAKNAFPKIRPIRMNGKDWYILLAHDYACRDLRTDTAWINAQLYAQDRGDNNPLFTGAYGVWDGVIVVDSEKVPILVDVGDSNCDVAVNMLLGAQALLYAQGGYIDDGFAAVKQREESFDYGRQWACAIMSLFGVRKAVFNGKQHGMLTCYTAAQPD